MPGSIFRNDYELNLSELLPDGAPLYSAHSICLTSKSTHEIAVSGSQSVHKQEETNVTTAVGAERYAECRKKAA